MEVLDKKTNTGFTLIELLVVISIIALLMAIVTPALSRARCCAKRIICSTRMKQISLAFTNYGIDNDGKIITASKIMTASNPWIWALLPYIDGDEDAIDTWDSPAKLWFCPCDKDPYPLGYSPHEMEYTSYALNGFYQGVSSGGVWGRKTPEIRVGPAGGYKYANIRHGSDCMLMAETSYYGQIYDLDNDKLSDYRLDDYGHHRNTSGFYHDGRMNVMFVDGHIDSVKGIDADEVEPPQTIRDAGYMFWSDLSLPDSQENKLLWGPGY